ncbi:acyl-CoA dehydratase activase [Enterococcus sp. LJL99]
MRVIGLDSGSTTTKGVLFEKGKLKSKKIVLTLGDPKKAAETIFTALGRQEDTYVVATGYGRRLLTADKVVTEITCHAKGAVFLHENIQYIVDIGGQDSKVIRIDKYNKVVDFKMNDKCAAGTGRFVEVLMRTLGEDLTRIDDFVAGATPIKINSMCTVFAESEVVSLIGKGAERADIALGVLHSIASRISNQLRQVNSTTGSIFFSGGLSHSETLAELISMDSKMPVYYDKEFSQYAGAIGAAKIGLQRNK